jgi:hypothetical protein
MDTSFSPEKKTSRGDAERAEGTALAPPPRRLRVMNGCCLVSPPPEKPKQKASITRRRGARRGNGLGTAASAPPRDEWLLSCLPSPRKTKTKKQASRGDAERAEGTALALSPRRLRVMYGCCLCLPPPSGKQNKKTRHHAETRSAPRERLGTTASAPPRDEWLLSCLPSPRKTKTKSRHHARRGARRGNGLDTTASAPPRDIWLLSLLPPKYASHGGAERAEQWSRA